MAKEERRNGTGHVLVAHDWSGRGNGGVQVDRRGGQGGRGRAGT